MGHGSKMMIRVKEIVRSVQSATIERAWFTGGILMLGIFVRIYQLDIRSLWRDEAWVALVASSDHLSSAFFTNWPVPPLFVSSLYMSVHLFKNNEWFLRIIPALFGIGGMVLIYYFIRKHLGRYAAIGALLVSAFLPVLIAYSRELKQYNGDIFFGLLLLLIADHLLEQKPGSPVWWGILAVAGAIGLWFSYPMVFVLFSISVVSLFYIFRKGPYGGERRRLLFFWLVTFSLVVISFSILYFMVIKIQSRANLESFWQLSFPDTTGFTPLLKWLLLSIWGFFKFIWNDYAFVVMPISLLGIWELIRIKKTHIIYFWAIIFILLLASAFFHLYPFGGNRVNLFTAPFFIILLISGLKFLWKLSMRGAILHPAVYLGIILLTVQIADAMIYCTKGQGYFWYQQYPVVQDMRSAISALEKERREGETLYVYYGGDLAFEYYSRHFYQKSFSPVVIGRIHRNNFAEYIEELKPLLEKKMPFWVLATHFYPRELSYIDNYLQTHQGYEGRIYYDNDGAVLIYYTMET